VTGGSVSRTGHNAEITIAVPILMHGVVSFVATAKTALLLQV